MPTYQYQCTDCGEPLEIQQSFTDDALTVCPSCGGRLRKVFNAVGVVFKGSGFYSNDSRPTSTSADAASTKSDTKSDKPAAASSSSSTTPKAAQAKKSGSESAA